MVVGGFVQRTKGTAVMVQYCSLFCSLFLFFFFLGYWAKFVLVCGHFFFGLDLDFNDRFLF